MKTAVSAIKQAEVRRRCGERQMILKYAAIKL